MNFSVSDPDIGLVLPLILLLMQEKTDFSLILALVYIIAS